MQAVSGALSFGATMLDTWRALFAPRRLFVILLVAIPLLTVQLEIGKALTTLVLPCGVILLFLLVVPAAYRSLFAFERRRETLPGRLLGFVAAAALPPLLSLYGPDLLGTDASFLVARNVGWIVFGLSLVGGYGLGRDIDLERRWRDAHDRAEGLAKAREQAQLLAIRAQLDPHFLFNTLNAIAEWCREDAEIAERALLDLSSLLRSVLGGIKAEAWRLADEVEIVAKLFALHGIREPGAFTVELDVAPEVRDAAVPPMLLLPLAENAMTHGPRRGHQGQVTLRAWAADGALHVELTNPGAFAGRRPGGEGLKMVEDRLALAAPEAHHLDIRAEGDRTVVQVVLPLVGQEIPENDG